MAIAAAIVGASALAAAGISAYSASKTNKAVNAQTDVAQQQAALAQQLADESSPLRQALLREYGLFTATGQLPASLTGADTQPNLYGLDTFAAGGALPAAVQPVARPRVPDLTALSRDTLERQFGRAREATISQAPTQGGHLAGALSDLEGERALGVTGLYNQQNLLQYGADTEAANRADALHQQLYGVGIDVSREQAARQQQLRSQLLGQSAGAGFGQIGPALQGLGGASASYGNIASTAFKGTELGVDALAALASYGLSGTAKKAPLYGALYGDPGWNIVE